MRTRLAAAVLAMIAGSACADTGSATDLHPEGPPMIRQVRMTERYLDSFMIERTRRVFAFGTHELAPLDEVHPVETAVAVGNHLRVIMDELLVGNNLEEVRCRGVVDSDPHPTFGRVPPGADPDDVARCAAPNDVLRSTCSGSDPESVCICRRESGCLRGVEVVPEGEPVGVQDANLDRAADELRFIPDAVGLQCGSISVPLKYDGVPPALRTYWNPSGDQHPPAMGGFEVLGPAIVIALDGPLPTNTRCGLVFSEDVVDKQGIRVCAPPGGDIAVGCAPGDVGAFSFGVEPLAIRPNSFSDGATNVPTTTALVFTHNNVPLDVATLGGIQISPAPPGTPMITTPMGVSIRIAFSMPLAPQTPYSVTFPTTITDTYGQPLPDPQTFSFTTGD